MYSYKTITSRALRAKWTVPKRLCRVTETHANAFIMAIRPLTRQMFAGTRAIGSSVAQVRVRLMVSIWIGFTVVNNFTSYFILLNRHDSSASTNECRILTGIPGQGYGGIADPTRPDPRRKKINILHSDGPCLSVRRKSNRRCRRRKIKTNKPLFLRLAGRSARVGSTLSIG